MFKWLKFWGKSQAAYERPDCPSVTWSVNCRCVLTPTYNYDPFLSNISKVSEQLMANEEGKIMMMNCDDTRPVKFTLARRYFCRMDNSNGMSMSTCALVFRNAFGRACDWFEVLKKKSSETGKVEVICTQSQFARFIIACYKYGGCKNGIQDLSPMSVDGINEKGHIEYISGKTGVTQQAVSAVLSELLNFEVNQYSQPIDVR